MSSEIVAQLRLLLSESNPNLHEKMIQELIAAVTELEAQKKKASEDLRQFAYMAAHDLKEPLRMMSSYLTLLGRKYMDTFDESGREFMTYAVDGSHRMKTLIDDLLSFSTIEYGRKFYRKVDCQTLVRKVTTNLSLALKEVDAKISIERLPEVWGDETQLRHLFQNLIANAVRFHSKRPLILQIDQRLDESAGQVKFSIRDNGIGIEMSQSAHIFEFFRRLHSRDVYPGTGIGLSICKRIVDEHGGKIWVEASEPGVGTTVSFTLPLYRGQGETLSPESSDGITASFQTPH